ncbi:hypothetical protein BMW22_30520 (plasmid) [Rhizobium leguminosarum]|uniref:Uncharacterized protein n=1 Tax=Rhizobium leguminosarum TaxID=384 RepID=A0A1L3ZJJ1_RHILE|nr:hypothetical protein BMW22_30520 [Rhizobium leguminosarum]
MTAGGDNRDALEDFINGYALRENGGLDRSAKLRQTLHKTRQPARVSHDFSAGPLASAILGPEPKEIEQ